MSSEWFSRPADERYLSLDELFTSVRGRAERSRTRIVESAAIKVEATRGNTDRLTLLLPGPEVPIAPTHWSFGQLAALVGAPAAYLRQLPARLAGINLQYGLTAHRAEQVKTLEADNGREEIAPSPVQIMVASTTMSSSRRYNGSPAMAWATRAVTAACSRVPEHHGCGAADQQVR